MISLKAGDEQSSISDHFFSSSCFYNGISLNVLYLNFKLIINMPGDDPTHLMSLSMLK